MSSEDCWVDGRSDQSIKDLAYRARKELQVSRKVPVEIIDCLKKDSLLTVKGRKNLKYEIVDDHKMGDDDANTELVNDVIVIRVKRSVHNQAVWGEGRARMTLAHELGHAVMHPGMAKARRTGAVGRHKVQNIPSYSSAEHQAKVFASAFLIDQEFAKNLESASAYSEEFSISLKAAEIAFEEAHSERRRRESAEIIRRIADDFMGQFNKKLENNIQFIGENCPNCGEKKLAPIGVKYHCYNCGNASDKFQDGDQIS
ncbi:ImmA/IrrE family metallo-endopeptidase [uncultured Methylobacterium sp.]|jgi:Zn-dependent peptidase ImmA (M78 family)|uniref:ImmA/IrrE family metallo-endopeptidase n=1 Tax=uncultured Methylobacterium sp. TaxID=157278 RepID=UPI00260309CE|nr:ImmA/IrrE family metallo-endopeptidase [uncultured Methylobacterium sp.]